MRVNKVTIEFETTNAAFMPDWEDEAKRILKELSERIDYEPHIRRQWVRDINGNKVGNIYYDYGEWEEEEDE